MKYDKKIFAGRVTTPGAGRVTVAELVGFYNPAPRYHTVQNQTKPNFGILAITQLFFKIGLPNFAWNYI